MIREAGDRFLEQMVPDREAKLKIRALWESYGKRPFARFFAGDGGTAIALMDSTALVAMGEDTVEDVALFLSMNPEVLSVRTDADTAAEIATHWRAEASYGLVMTPSRPLEMDVRVKTAEPRAVYPTLRAVFGSSMPPFDNWYADVHYRRRHGSCRLAAITEEGTVVATAMTTAECAGAALIGAVATLPASRGRGLASACVSTLASGLMAEGRRVLLSPKNDRAALLYHRLGFVPCGRWGVVTRRPGR